MQHEDRQAGLQVDSSNPDRLFREALFFLQRKEPNMAAHVLMRALELRPREPRYLSYLGVCKAMDNRRSPEALPLCEEALGAGCYDALLYCNLGKVHLLQGNRRKARVAFLWGLKVDPSSRDILQELRAMGIRRRAFFRLLSREHVVNRLAGRLRHLLRRPVV